MAEKKFSTRKLTGLAILTALVVILQFLPIKGPFFLITLTLVPIVIGSALYGAFAGAWLGFIFGVTVLLSGDAAAFLTINIPGTIATVLVKGTLAGLAAGLVYKLASKVNRYFGVICSALVAPVVNTGIFLLGCRLFFMDTVNGWAAASGYENVGAYMILSLVGINFLIELGVDLVCSPVILRLINIRKKEG
ncbi:MAG: ECF transporter S component [Eubacteriales bacterium]|nr:ECF transporter S component [Eubacteriales bacterium]